MTEKKAAKKKAAFVPKFVGGEPVMKRLDLYKPNDWNPNEVTPEERKSLRETLRKNGWVKSQAMLVWASDEAGKAQNIIIDGEHRWEEAMKLGFVEGPVVELKKCTRADAVSWTLRIDKIRGHFNDRKVAKVLDSEFGLFAGREETADIALRLGFSEDEIDKLRLKLPEVAGAGARMLNDSAKQSAAYEEEPEELERRKPLNPQTKIGDYWKLGPHRLVCGDCFRPESRALIGLKSTNLVITDSPYAIYGSSTGIGTDIADDSMVRPFFEELGRLSYSLLPIFGHAYFCCDWRSWSAVWDTMHRAGLSGKNCLIWHKGKSGLGSSYANTYEMVGFFSKLAPPKSMKNVGPTGQRTILRPNVIALPRPAGDERNHNAAKPPELFEELMRNSSDEGDSVTDFFLGGGTTLVVAEALGRVCYAFDKDPGWCDVAVDRWERVSGKKAELVRANGKTEPFKGLTGVKKTRYAATTPEAH